MQRFTPENSLLVVIDIQGKLAERMFAKEALYHNTIQLIEACRTLEIPIIVTEQAPDKIGATVKDIKAHLKESPVKKTSFSCALNHEFMQKLRASQRKKIIVCGIEAHVCVFQTVYDLLEQQFDVQVIVDAVSSRSQENKILAVKRLEKTKAILSSTEMVICELLKGAGHPQFKQIMSLLK